MQTFFKKESFRIIPQALKNPTDLAHIFTVQTMYMLTDEVEQYMRGSCDNFEKKGNTLKANGISLEICLQDPLSLTITVDFHQGNKLDIAFKRICALLTKPGSMNFTSKESTELRQFFDTFMKVNGLFPSSASPSKHENGHDTESSNFSCN